jgi:hypothetical protein
MQVIMHFDTDIFRRTGEINPCCQSLLRQGWNRHPNIHAYAVFV